jgi:hypothetical protein
MLSANSVGSDDIIELVLLAFSLSVTSSFSVVLSWSAVSLVVFDIVLLISFLVLLDVEKTFPCLLFPTLKWLYGTSFPFRVFTFSFLVISTIFC